MAQELTLRTNDKPSFFNKELLIGGLAATVTAAVGLGLLTPIGMAVVAGGAIAGSVIGEKRMESEAILGKKVGEPSFWNKDTLLGGLLGAVASPLPAIVTAAITVSLAAVLLPALIPTALSIGLIGGTAASIATGAYVGGKLGELNQTKEYQAAKEQTIVNNISKEVSPGVAQAVEYAMANDKTKNWAKHIEDERNMAQGHEQHR
jgi:hypothetical protein